MDVTVVVTETKTNASQQKKSDAMGGLRKPSSSEVADFDKLDLRSALRYHLTYHFSRAIHRNHLLFLSTYLLGVALSLAAWRAAATLTAAAAYSVYAAWLLRGAPCAAACFVVYIGVQCAGALWLAGGLGPAGDAPLAAWSRWQRAMLGLGAVLGSFCAQLVGHARYEELHAPRPHLFHGFVAAPVLEWASALLRRPQRPQPERQQEKHGGGALLLPPLLPGCAELVKEVVELRQRALEQHGLDPLSVSAHGFNEQ